jgi:hypothetical protein
MFRLDQNRAARHNRANGLQARRAHRLARFNQIDNPVGDAERTRCLDAAAHVLDVCPQLLGRVAVRRAAILLRFQTPEILLREVCEARHDVLANQVFGRRQAALGGDLHLQRAFAKAEVEDFLDAGCGGGRDDALVLGDLVAPGYSQVNAALADKGGDVGGGQEHEGQRQVLDERDVEARVPVELDVGPVEEVETGLVKTALYRVCQLLHTTQDSWSNVLLGTANSSRSFRLCPRTSVNIGKLLLPWRGLVSMPPLPFAASPFCIETMFTQISQHKKVRTMAGTKRTN